MTPDLLSVPTTRDTLGLQPLFPLALGHLQLAPDPLDTAVLLQEILQLRGEACQATAAFGPPATRKLVHLMAC